MLSNSPELNITLRRAAQELTLNHDAISLRRLSGFRSLCSRSKSATRTWNGALPLFLGGATPDWWSPGGGDPGGDDGAGVGMGMFVEFEYDPSAPYCLALVLSSSKIH